MTYMDTMIVSIEGREDPGSPYYLTAVTPCQVGALEQAAKRAGLEAVVRRADTYEATMSWLREQRLTGQR
jgi:hypothetical protein